MSRSTSRTPRKPADENEPRFAGGERRESRWLAWSLLLHVLGIAALIVFTPVGDVLLEAGQPRQQADLVLTPQKAQELADQIRKLNVKDLQEHVEALQQVDQEMDQLRVEQRDKLTEEQVKPDEQAPAQAMEAMQRTLDRMDHAADAMAKRADDGALAQQLRDVEDAQDQASNALMGAGMQFDPVRRAQKQAIVEQLEVQGWQQQIADSQGQAKSLDGRIEKLQADLQQYQDKTIQPDQDRMADAAKRRQEIQEKIDQAKQDQDRTQMQLADADAKTRPTLQRRLEQQKRTTERLEKAVTDQRASEKKLAEAAEKHAAYQAKRQGDLAEMRQQKLDAERKAEQAAERRSTQQTQAELTQRQAMAELEKAMRQPQQMQQTQVAADVTAPPTSADPVKLYDQARDLEEKITDAYRQVRAAELAKIQNMKLAEAMARVDVPQPVREPVDRRSLQKQVQTAAALQDYKQELMKVEQHMQSMQASTEAMLAAAKQVKQDFADELASALTVHRQQMLEAKALENAGNKAADLTELMNPQASAAATAEADASGHEPGGTTAAAAAIAEAVPEVPKQVKAMPGRSVGMGGVQAEWMYLDSWWMVGPFANPQRKNIHRKFPPETVVDLDAVYVGEGGRPIRWKFVQATQPFVRPPGGENEYSIWYAYTQVRFDQPTDCWIAVGSDDRSDLWINGQKVWASSDELKGWRIDEGYRKVRFEAGVNRILCRIENGWHTMGFSVLVHTEPQTSASASP